MGETPDIQVTPLPGPEPAARRRLPAFLKRRWVIAAAAALALAAVVSATVVMRWREDAERERLRAERWNRWLAMGRSLEAEVRAFGGVPGIVVKDLATNWEFTYRKHDLFPAASLVKLPIMLALLEANQEGMFSLDDRFALTEAAKTGGSGVLKGMPAGSTFTVDELIGLMIGASDNTATNMLIALLDYELINERFRAYGLRQTNLSRKMMDFKSRKRGVENYTSASDISLALEKLYRGEFLDEAYSDKCLELLKRQRVRDRIPKQLPPEAVVAHKTGLERRVCHDAGIVYTPHGDFLICVLTKDTSNARAAKNFIAQVASTVYEFYDR